MFDNLINKLSAIVHEITSKGKINEKDIEDILRQIRIAFLEADVNYKVVKILLDQIKQRALSADFSKTITPGQIVLSIVYEEINNILGKNTARLNIIPNITSKIMIVGLQGSGKTTTAAKLAYILKKEGHLPLLIAADIQRPAAIEQLAILAKQIDVPIFIEMGAKSTLDVINNAMEHLKRSVASVVIIDTQGRLHVDQNMMNELISIKQILSPNEILLTIDSMVGQESIKIAEEFHKNLSITGIIMTKADGDARGGAALSIRYMTGIPIKYLGVGEKINALEVFHPDRITSRILGMGDLATLIEKTKSTYSEHQLNKIEKKIKKAEFDLEDFLQQIKQIQKMGSISQLLSMIPGMSRFHGDIDSVSETQIKKVEAIILSMTPVERKHPEIINGSRKKRIALGSGTTTKDVNQLLNQFEQVKKLSKLATKNKISKLNLPNIFK